MVYTPTDGSVFSATNVNNVFSRPVASTPYTGSAFDASRASGAGTGTTSNNTTLTCAALSINDYVRIVVMCNVSVLAVSAGETATVTLTLETSVASAASWTTRLTATLATADNGTSQKSQTGVKQIEFYYAPTSGEKSGGLDIRITGSAGTTTTGSSSISNIQTMVYAN